MTATDPWGVELGSRARKDLKRLDPPIRAQIFDAIRRLAAGDRALNVLPLSGIPGERLRVRDWRVIFERDVQARTIVILRVLPRGRAYER